MGLDMGLRDRWRRAIREIAERNGQSCPGDQVRATRHLPKDDDLLRDCVVFLLWAKLTRRCEGTIGPAGRHVWTDSFLSLTELHNYLQERVPPYSTAEVDDFIESLFRQQLLLPTGRPPNQVLAGDLRVWLLQKRYEQEDIDITLQHEDADRFLDPPDEVEREWSTIKDDEERCRRRAKWVRAKRVALLRDNRLRTIPLSIRGWATFITHELVTGTCNCTRYFVKRLGTEQANRCRETHYLSRDNLNAAFAGGTRRWPKGGIKDELEFVERAVVWGLELVYRHRNPDPKKGEKKFDLGPSDDFGKSMFCSHFRGPNDVSLRLDDYHMEVKDRETGEKTIIWKFGLTDTRQVLSDEPETIYVDRPIGLICFCCPTCQTFVGAPDVVRTCRNGGHAWIIGRLPPCRDSAVAEDADEEEGEAKGEFYPVDVNRCAADHFWPAKNRRNVQTPCPICTRHAVETIRRLSVFVPTNRGFDDVEWAEPAD